MKGNINIEERRIIIPTSNSNHSKNIDFRSKIYDLLPNRMSNFVTLLSSNVIFFHLKNHVRINLINFQSIWNLLIHFPS
jgi:hypothetical protein